MPTKTFFCLRDEKQETILRSAIREFIANGFTRAKTSDIAQNAGVSKGSIFQYFEDKKELFTYCAQWSLAVFMKKLDARMNVGGMDIYEYFLDNTAKIEIMREESELAAFMQILMNEPGLLGDSMKGMYDIGNVYTKKLIKNGKDRGTVRDDIDDDMLFEFFSAVTERFSQRWFRLYIRDFSAEVSPEAERAINEELNQMLELIKKGMGR